MGLFAAAAAIAAATLAPQRIVSMVPAFTEILFAIGAGEQVVGVTEFCRYPPEAERREKIGGYADLSFEKLLSLKPDLVVLANYAHRAREQCASANLPTLTLKYDTVEELLAAMETLGNATGHAGDARAAIRKFRAELARIHSTNAGRPAQRTLLVIGRSPGSFQGLLAVGPGSFLNDLLNVAGGTNVLADVTQPWPQINIEAVLARKPEVIIELPGERATGVPAPDEVARLKADWNRFSSLPAVAAGRVGVLLSDHALIPGPRMTDTARALAELLQ